MREAAGGEAFDRAWTKLIADVRAEMDSGGDPTTDRAKALGRRWRELVDQFTKGDVAVERLLYQAADKYRANCEGSGLVVSDAVGWIRRVFEALDA